MHRLSKNLKLFVSLVILFASCQAKKVTPFEQLKKAIQEPALAVHYDTLQRIHPDKVTIVYPVLKDSVFQVLVSQSVAADTSETYCDRPGGETRIFYQVMHNSLHLFSYRKDVDIMFCYAGDVVSSTFDNYWKGEGLIHKVVRNPGYSFKALLQQMDTIPECHFDTTAQQHLYFMENMASLFVKQDKVCQTTIPLTLENDQVSIKP